MLVILPVDMPDRLRSGSCHSSVKVPFPIALSRERTFLFAIEASSTAIFCHSTFLASAWAKGACAIMQAQRPAGDADRVPGRAIFTDPSDSQRAEEPGKSALAAAAPCHRRFLTALQSPDPTKVAW